MTFLFFFFFWSSAPGLGPGAHAPMGPLAQGPGSQGPMGPWAQGPKGPRAQGLKRPAGPLLEARGLQSTAPVSRIKLLGAIGTIKRINRINRIVRKRCQQLRLRPPPPHALGVRMTVVTRTPSNYINEMWNVFV